MKVKIQTPDRFVIGFTRRELMMVNNCLNEACHGLLMDRFIPARDQLIEILDSLKQVRSSDLFKLSQPAV